MPLHKQTPWVLRTLETCNYMQTLAISAVFSMFAIKKNHIFWMHRMCTWTATFAEMWSVQQSTLLYPIMQCSNLTYQCYELINISNIYCNFNLFFVKFHENYFFNQVSSPVCHRINSFFFMLIFSRKSTYEWFTYSYICKPICIGTGESILTKMTHFFVRHFYTRLNFIINVFIF